MHEPPDHMPMVVTLSEVDDNGAAVVGAKAANLARMHRAGFPVPPGFCLTRRAYREHLSTGDLLEHVQRALAGLADGSAEDRRRVLAEIRRTIAGAPLSDAVREAVGRYWRNLGGGPAAVRSSALAEDLPGQSFAGQYDTYLGVTDLPTCLARIKDCWASLWTERAYEYRRHNGLGHLDVDMAVIVQALVPAEVAGVMFTADPVTGRRDCAVIEASFGLGEAVVAGKVTPDRLVVSKRVFRVERRTTAAKTVEVAPQPSGGVREQGVDAARAVTACLDDAAAGRLALLGADIEILFGAPQDVEWAFAAGQLHVLQARPITALPPAPARSWEDRQVWTNANLREVAPDVVTPATYTLVQQGGPRLMEPLFGPLGIEIDPERVAGLVAGRLYFNINMGVALMETLPMRWRSGSNILFGGGGGGVNAPQMPRFPKEDLPELRVRRHRRLTCLPEMLWRLLCSPLHRGWGMFARLKARVAAVADEPWRALSDEHLARRILAVGRLAEEELLKDGKIIVMAAAGMGYCVLLMHLCRRWLGDEHADTAKRLLAGLGGMEDAEAGIALWSLAGMAHGDAELGAAIRQEEHFENVVRRVAGSAAGQGFLGAWSDFMKAHGHHGGGELELINPRWAEQPDHILALVRSHLAGMGRVDPVAQARRLGQERRRLTRDCSERLRNPIKRLIFNAVRRRAQEGARFRQSAKSVAVGWVALVRQMLLELGDRLVRRGILGQRDDVFFLRMDELVPAAAGRYDPRVNIEHRLAEYRRNAALDPPPVVFGRFDPEQSAPEVVDDRAGVLWGMGVSAGVGTGPARVILRAGDGQVMPGEVLVAPVTDPSWTPYFVNAAAIVMDQGGQLSHGSILAREYGIPCVVNAGPATRIIKTGQTLEVDGSRGAVRIVGHDPLCQT